MAIFAIGDLHLSTSCDKPMDIFSGWDNYTQRLESSWRQQVGAEDTVVLAGDISWGMTLEQALSDFQLIHALPGKKILLKGNHDYWWNSRRKMEDFFMENGLNSLTILHNSTVASQGVALCGTRGWMLEEGSLQDKKVTAREEGRLRTSLQAAEKLGLQPIVFLHYPPIYGENISGGMIELMRAFGVQQCFYGHLHGASCGWAVQGDYLGLKLALISADYLNFTLKQING